MKIESGKTEKAILAELGQRIKQNRIAMNISQEGLAEKCRISASTVVRIENGVDSKMSNYIRILSELKMLDNFDVLVPEVKPDFKALYLQKPQRQRASLRKDAPKSDWVWGEDRK